MGSGIAAQLQVFDYQLSYEPSNYCISILRQYNPLFTDKGIQEQIINKYIHRKYRYISVTQPIISFNIKQDNQLENFFIQRTQGVGFHPLCILTLRHVWL